MAEKCKGILIIDDQPVFLEGFRSILSCEARYSIIGEAGTGSKGIHLAESLRPDLIVMEIILPDQNAFKVIRKLRNILPKTPVLILSAYSQSEFVITALKSGARGYIMKCASSRIILKGIETLLEGVSYLDGTISPNILLEANAFLKDHREIIYDHDRVLTPREEEIMGMLAQGLSRKEIAARLSISTRTVENHASNIMRKFPLKNTVGLIRHAAKIGLIDVDNWKYGSPATEVHRLMAI